MTIGLLDIDTDPKAYLALHGVLDEPTADNALTPREREVRELARRVVATDVAPRAQQVDREHLFVHDSVQALANAGLLGLIFPRHLGGTADSHVAYALATEEIAAGCASTSLVFVTQMHTAYPILIAGGEELASRYIPGLLDGSVYGSLAITEPNAGSDVSSLRTTAVPAADRRTYEINGSKTFITTGDRSGVIICFATINRALGRKGITAFVVDGGWHGVGRGRPFQKLGMNGSSTAEVYFDRVQVPADHVLGGEGQGWTVLMDSVVKSRISAAAQGVGLARAAYARTLSALTRLNGGRIPEDKAFGLADLRGRILQGRLLLHAVARQLDHTGDVSPGQIGIMKQCCTDLGFAAAVEATRILGAYGDQAWVGVERCVRDAKVTQIYDGTNEIQRLLVSRETARAMGTLA